MKYQLRGIFFLEEELKGIPGFRTMLRLCKRENPKLFICPITLEGKAEGSNYSAREIFEEVGDFKNTCLFLGASDQSLALAKSFNLAVVAVRNPAFEQATGACPDLMNAGYLLDFKEFDAGELLSKIDLEYFERVFRRHHGIPWDILETKRCLVREISLEDLDQLFELYSHSEVTEFMEPLYEREEEFRYQKAYIENMYGFYEYGMWLVFDKEGHELIGRAGLENREYPEGQQVELGYAFSPDYWHKGYAREVCKAILSYGRDYLEIDQVNCLIHPKNQASIKVAEALGMKFLGETMFTGQLMLRYQSDTTFVSLA